jgi:hypothetical protein
MAKAMHMETTKVEASKTASEIQALLGQFGCSAVMIDYDEHKYPCAMAFTVTVLKAQSVSFRLPINVDPIFNIFQKRRSSWDRSNCATKDREQARRVAWRQVLRWIQAQLAMIEVGMVRTEEVFLPYWVNPNTGQSLFQCVLDSGFKQPQLEDRT